MVQHKAPHRPWEPSAKNLAKFRGPEVSGAGDAVRRLRETRPAAKRADMRISQMRPASDVKLWEADDPERQLLLSTA